MENEVQLHEEEVVNPEEFQPGHNSGTDLSRENMESETASDEGDYTQGETEFADGAGRHLDKEIEAPENDQLDLDGDGNDQNETEQENSEEDPA